MPCELTEEQRAALEHTLASRDLVMDVSGSLEPGNRIFSKRSRKQRLLFRFG
jgi:hypothetical protein